MNRTNNAERKGLVQRAKRRLKIVVRNAVVRRWFFTIVVKTVVWLIKRWWDDHSNLSP